MANSRIIRSIAALATFWVICGCSIGCWCQDATKTRGVELTLEPMTYYALVIGNNDYELPLKTLKAAVNDAESIAEVLKREYGFDVELLRDATRNDILSSLYRLRRSLIENSSLLIFYAGHGAMDPANDVTYWLPVDASGNDNVNRISAADIRAELLAIPSRHILIISDSCYAGGLTRGDAPYTSAIREEKINDILARKSRNLLASGGMQSVIDVLGDGAGHSAFAEPLLNALRTIEERSFTTQHLFDQIHFRVLARQTPQYNFIPNSGDDGGDFVFQRTPPVHQSHPFVHASLSPPRAQGPPQQQGSSGNSGIAIKLPPPPQDPLSAAKAQIQGVWNCAGEYDEVYTAQASSEGVDGTVALTPRGSPVVLRSFQYRVVDSSHVAQIENGQEAEMVEMNLASNPQTLTIGSFPLPYCTRDRK